MKKGFTWLLILLLLLTTFTPAVYAKETKKKETNNKVQVINLDKVGDGEEEETHTASNNIRSNGFSITIDKFYLNVYEINQDSPEVTETSTDGNTTITISEDEIKYRNEETYSTYDIPEEFYQKSMSVKTGKMSGVDTLFIDAAITITQEDLEEILEDEMELTTASKSFLVDLCADVIMEGIPSKYSHVYTYDYVRILQNIANIDHVPEFDLDEANRIVVNRITITADDTGKVTVSFPKEIEGRNAISFMNFFGLSSQEITKPSDEPEYYVMIYNVDNIERLMDGYEEGDNPSTSTTDDIVPIPDTGKMVNGLFYVEGAILMITGLGIIYSTTKRKQKRD